MNMMISPLFCRRKKHSATNDCDHGGVDDGDGIDGGVDDDGGDGDCIGNRRGRLIQMQMQMVVEQMLVESMIQVNILMKKV